MTLLSALYRLKSPTSFSGLTVHPTDLITPSHLHFIAFLSVTAATRHFQITHFTVNDTFRRSAFSNYRLLIHACACAHGRRLLRKSRGDKNRFPLDREIVLKIAKNSFTVVIVDKGLCNVSAVRFYQEIINGHDRS